MNGTTRVEFRLSTCERSARFCGDWTRRTGRRTWTSPGLRLHPLKGDLTGHWAVDVSRNRRMTFRFDGNDVRDVDLLDYH